jgi:hypothetical protein
MFGVTQGIEDRGERSDGGYGGEQDGSGAERLAAGDTEAGSGESGTTGPSGNILRVSAQTNRNTTVVKYMTTMILPENTASRVARQSPAKSD